MEANSRIIFQTMPTLAMWFLTVNGGMACSKQQIWEACHPEGENIPLNKASFNAVMLRAEELLPDGYFEKIADYGYIYKTGKERHGRNS